MTLSLNPVSTSNITAARPAVSNCAVAVWDPIGSHVRTGKAAPVRTLSRSSQWEELASPVGWKDRSAVRLWNEQDREGVAQNV